MASEKAVSRQSKQRQRMASAAKIWLMANIGGI